MITRKVSVNGKLKNIVKDGFISALIAFFTFYLMYLIKGSILHSDLYNQGIDFLEYFRDGMNIFSKDWLYNWNIALGDSMYSLSIYYLLSPFNLLLLLTKGLNIVKIVPIFIAIKMTFMAYFASLYFKKVTEEKYKWIGTIIYVASYYIMVYGNYQIMWLDTFVFLPLLLFAIENVIKNKNSGMYILTLFVFIASDYYLAAILVPHIAMYAIFRYFYLEGKKDLFKFIFRMLRLSIVAAIMASFVLLPAISVMTTSAKEISTAQSFGITFVRLKEFFTNNYIGVLYSNSNTYITLLGMMVFIPFLIFGKNNKVKIFYIHIGILLVALISDKVNYILNLNYIPAGGAYRYNLFLNIYIAIFVYYALKEIINKESFKLKVGIIAVGIINVGIMIISQKSLSFKMVMINIICIALYSILIFIINKKREWIVYLLSCILMIEVTGSLYYIYQSRNEVANNTRYEYRDVINYISDKYGDDKRIEIRDTPWSWNIYLANDVPGVAGYHSLINGNYKEISNVLSNTNKETVRNEFKGRNIVGNLIGTKYFATLYEFSPYKNSKLVDKYGAYYIYEIESSEFKYYSKDNLITGRLSPSMIEKDALLYKYLYSEELGKDIGLFNKNEVLNKIDINNKSITINQKGDYYLYIPKEYNISNVEYYVNGKIVGQNTNFDNVRLDELDGFEISLGYLNSGDVLEFKDEIINKSQLVFISGDYIEEVEKKEENLKILNLEKSSTGLKANIKVENTGYLFMPIVYDDNWEISLNGNTIEALKVNGGFTAIEVEAGTQEIIMKYKPKMVYLGVGITLIAITGFGLYYGLGTLFRKRK